MEKTLKPALRFKGFTDTWEQYKLKQVTVYKNGKGHEHLQSDIGDYELINLNSISIDGGLKPSGRFVSYSDDTLSKDDLVMVLSDVAHGDLLGRVALIPENNKYVLNQRVALLRSNGVLNPNYLYYIINNNQNYFKLQGAGSSQLNISKDSVENFSFLAPNSHEQSDLTLFFDKIDNLITLHQRKHEKLINVKKALLDKMFPKNGELVPQLRFKGFTDTWEQRELLQVARYRNGKAHENEIDETGQYIVVNSKFVSTDGEIKKFTNNLIEPLYENELAFVLSDVPNGKAIARTFLVKDNDKYSLNQRIAGITPNESTHPYFLSILMNRNKYFLSFDDGAKQTNLSKSDVEKFESRYPVFQEQSKIGALFENLDSLITLHQRKYEKLVNIKRALLQKMFV